MATAQRTIPDKIADAQRVYEAFRDELTPDNLRQMVTTIIDKQAEAAKAGDLPTFAGLVQASMEVQKVMFANDRAALQAAAIITQSGVVKPVFTEEN